MGLETGDRLKTFRSVAKNQKIDCKNRIDRLNCLKGSQPLF